jgi:2-oxoglutarate ferredoxin oxidoreductase subunit alpha
MFTLTVRAFNLAEEYRTPVILLSDETVAHMREQITVPSLESIKIFNRNKPRGRDISFFGVEEVPPMPTIGEGFNVTVTGSTHDEYGIRSTADPGIHRELVRRLNDKIINHDEEISDIEAYNIKDCEIALVSYGCTSRAIYETVEKAEDMGVKIGFIRLKTIWPFPDRIIRNLAEKAAKIFVPELNLGQIVKEVERAVDGAAEVIPLNKIGGGELITPEEMLINILGEEGRND